MTLTQAKGLMQAAHSIWPEEIRAQQSREYRREIEHSWFRISLQVMKGEYPGLSMKFTED